MTENTEGNLSVGRNIKIGLFHLGSGLADILMTGVWNRVMISDLNFAAGPIGLLAALRYFLAPIGIWAGRISDERSIFGFHRLFWIWSGRAMMVVSAVLLGLITASLARGAEATAIVWAGLVITMLLFGLGSGLSGSTFLALIYDRAPEHQRGRAVGIVWTFLLLGYSIGGPLFGRLLPSIEGDTALSFSPDTLQMLFLVTAVILAVLWFVSLWGEETRGESPRIKSANPESYQGSVWSDLQLVWQNHEMRFFLIYLALSMFFAFSQDAILEPFAGDVFGMPAATTNRFAGYWGSMAIVGTLVFLWLSRRYTWLTHSNMSYIGVGFLVVAFGIFGLSSLAEIRPLVTIGLIILGIGLGIWNVGTLGLMMDMSPLGRAGTFLGFWTLVVTFARGFGVSEGGLVHDAVMQVTGHSSVAYGVVFVIGAVGLGVALWTLRQVNVKAFKSEVEHNRDLAAVFAGAME